ncbi:sigma-54-dependent transcriptional regulator [Taibaiella soli]|uniref:Sigma-54-dependent Fis family transcriptional regulator n=1 Tax=Taibaiella soli TaxID=1649169 RepID=A0A2W2A9K3_9BACT|nr:sigma-54 dependent transcriptional regulator [Taibaiella soli]PZF72055.1 sigma-54-dependent Fis family transcriptional regulator [Taibaiella soli]
MNILLVEDDSSFVLVLENFLKRQGHQVTATSNVKDSIKVLQKSQYDLLLLDYRLPDGTGIDILQHEVQVNARIPAIMMTSFHDIKTAVKAMRCGAFDFITKPVNPDELLMIMRDALTQKNQQEQQTSFDKKFIEGTSEAATMLYQHIRLVAPTDMSVIIQGESGTGKEHIARTIHRLSKRSTGPFVAIDCGALSNDLASSELFGHVKGAFTGALNDREGHFVTAGGGTLFLDEIGNLSYEIQVKLLRALQERIIQPTGSNKQIKVDVRVIVATNEDLPNAVKNGGFRQDLYHRLNEFTIKVPSLKQRKEDLTEFIQYFIQEANKELDKSIKGLDKEVTHLFHHYEWPGNLRELKNIIKRSVLLSQGDLITEECLPEDMLWEAEEEEFQQESNQNLKVMQATNEKEMILKTLQEVKFNKSKAARLLHIDRKTLYYKMSKYNIDP